MSDPTPARARGPVAQGLAAARANLLPALLLNVVAVTIACLYAWHEPTRAVLADLAALKDRAPWIYAAIATPIFGALLPFLLIRLGTARPERWGALPFLIALWAVKGLEVNALYDFQAWLFGEGRDVATVALKVAVDQGIYVPLWACPSLVLAYRFKDLGFDGRATRRELDRGWYRRRVVPVLITNLAIWIPAVSCIYTLPTPLQLPMQNLVLCLFVLLLAFLTDERNQPAHELAEETQP